MQDLSQIIESAEADGIDAALRSLGDAAAGMGVKLRIRYDDRVIALEHIQRMDDAPKGSGAIVMNTLLQAPALVQG